jgi:hypothetical protein
MSAARPARRKESIVSRPTTKVLLFLGIVLAIGGATGVASQDMAVDTACAQSSHVSQRTEVVMTLLRLRYQDIEALETILRSGESEEIELRGSIAQSRAQLATLNKAGRDELAAVLKGLEEQSIGLRERNSNDRGQLAIKRHEVGTLEMLVRSWLETTP